MYLAVAIVWISGFATANVVPAYSDYKDTLAFLDQIDIKQFKETFENGEDPFACMMDGNQINSVSGVLKSYFRKLTEPLFSEAYFDQFMNITSRETFRQLTVHNIFLQETLLLPMLFQSRKNMLKVRIPWQLFNSFT